MSRPGFENKSGSLILFLFKNLTAKTNRVHREEEYNRIPQRQQQSLGYRGMTGIPIHYSPKNSPFSTLLIIFW